jgi:hypothetical protein
MEDLNNSFLAGMDNQGHNLSQHLRVKQMKSAHQQNRMVKPAPISSVHMAKDIYRKGNTVSQSSTRTAGNVNANNLNAYRRPMETR